MAKKIRRKRSHGKSPVLPSLPSRHSMERMTADIHHLLEEQEFESPEEANKFLQGLLSEGGRIPQSPGRSSLEKAQDLAWEAWDAATPQQAAKLARRALAISPDCADAYNVLAQVEAGTPEEAYEFYRKAVEVGERSLGQAFFEEHKGHFWGVLASRPYMRARQGLADCLWAIRREEESIAHSEALLDLNPNDNQGIRDTLLSRYLSLGNDADAERLFRQYKNDWSAAFLWSRVLLDFRRGDHVAANAALLAAMEYNSHVASFLTCKKKLPAKLPETYSSGSRDEAVLYMASFAEAWLVSSNALEWLIGQLAN